MKILVLTSTYSRWDKDTDPKFVDNLCHYLSRENEVHVVAPHARGTLTEEQKQGIRIFRYRYFFERWETLAYDGGILPRLKENKFRLLLVPFFILAQLLAVVKLLRRHDYDVIHAHWIIPQGLVALLARPFARVQPAVVATSHGGDLFALKGRLLGQIKRWITQRVDRLTVVSSTMKNKAVQQDLKAAQDISVIPMGVETYATFCPPQKPGQRKGLLFVGRLVDKKGIEYLIQAVPAVLEQDPDQTLTIIGSGPMQQDLEELSRTLGVSDQVNFRGAVVNTDIPALLQASEITVFPSVVTDDGDQEGTPVAIMEALACECATVVSDYPGARDIIEDDMNGLLVAPKSPPDIARKINQLIASPDNRERLGKNGRKSVQERYDWRVISAKFQTVFEQCLSSEHSSRHTTPN